MESLTIKTKIMSTERRNNLSELFKLMWQFIRRNGYSRSEALRCAWANLKLKAEMGRRIVRFYFLKVDGTVREAFGTLKADILPETKGTGRKANDTLQTYYDTEKQEYRSFKKANLIKIA